jgi:hypothetical protein
MDSEPDRPKWMAIPGNQLANVLSQDILANYDMQ